jgi:hypothetical protein
MRADRFSIAANVVVRGVAVCAFIAFLSLLTQIRGLVGEDGIIPARAFLARITYRFDAFHCFVKLPGLHWLFGASNAALYGMCVAGMITSALVVAGVAQGPLLVVSYLLYLSLCHCGQVFLGYQWDMLLCESLIIAALIAPWRLRRRNNPALMPLLACLALAARLEIGSGLSKLLSGDETWRSLTALQYHYETQPLPTPLGWLAAHFPPSLQVASCFAMFAIQLGAPLLLFVPWRKIRHTAVFAMTALQVAIALTGNYTFFNALTILLSLAAVDDDGWRSMGSMARAVARSARRLLLRVHAPKRSGAEALQGSAEPASVSDPNLSGARADDGERSQVRADVSSTSTRAAVVSTWMRSIAAAVLIPLGVVAEIDRLTREPMPEPLGTVMEVIGPFELVGGYGLFANMTTERDEIEVEGTIDGREWVPYVFNYKPSDVDKMPGFVAPHQPRLDWQMWFAALSTPRRQTWFEPFMDKLLDADPAVLSLLASDPFAGQKPLQVRAIRWRYHVAPLGSGHVWTREAVGIYAGPISRLKI